MYGMFWGASSFNQNIGGWSVDYVYGMGQMFNSASSFNQDIGAWSVDNVRDMHRMFEGASSFNQDISAWNVENVRDMHYMFNWASAFSQNLNWCVDDDVNLDEAFSGTPYGVGWQSVAGDPWFMRSSTYGEPNGDYEAGCWLGTWGWTTNEGFEFHDGSCGACFSTYLCSTNLAKAAPSPAPTSAAPTRSNTMSDAKIRAAVRAWAEDRAAAEATYGHISTWETSEVTDMSHLFCVWQDWMEGQSWYDDCVSAASFNEDISAWDTSGVTRMYGMFWYASSFNQNIGGWSVDNVYEMGHMFTSASAFDQDISAWSVDNVRDMHQMFSSASSFNQNIGGWSVAQVTNMHWMFGHASSFNQDIGGWRVYNVRDMHYMFHHASAFDQDLSSWETSGVTNMNQMFSWASSFDQDIGGWSVENVRDMHYMFHYASAFDQDLDWCVDNDVNLDEAFSGTPCVSTSCGVVQGRSEGGICVTLAPTFFDGAFGDESIRTAVRAWMEDRAAAEATYGHISTWDTSGVTDMSWLFCVRQDWMEGESWADNCVLSTSSFNEDIGAWDTSGVTRMYGMFWGASSFNQNIGGWSVENVYEMGMMFHHASAFDQDISAWSVVQVTNMHRMFEDASSFNQDIGGWSVEQVMDMHKMFGWASSFNQDIGGWRVEQVTEMSYMFHHTSSFNQDLSWCIGNDVNLDGAFSGSGCCSMSCGVAQKDETGDCKIIDSWDCYYYYDDDDDDDDGATELVMSTGLAAIGITFTGLTIAAIANAVQEQCALGPTIVYEAGTTHPYYISPNLCTIGTKTFSSDKTVRDASPRKVCRKFCEAASEKGKLALKHVQGLTCYCKRR